MKKRVTFQRYQFMKKGIDGKGLKVSFIVADSSFIGLPEEKQYTEQYHIVVSLSKKILDASKLYHNEKIRRMLLRCAKRHIQNIVRTNQLKNGAHIILQAGDIPADSSFEIERIPDVNGYSFEVEVEEPKIGFC